MGTTADHGLTTGHRQLLHAGAGTTTVLTITTGTRTRLCPHLLLVVIAAAVATAAIATTGGEELDLDVTARMDALLCPPPHCHCLTASSLRHLLPATLQYQSHFSLSDIQPLCQHHLPSTPQAISVLRYQS